MENLTIQTVRLGPGLAGSRVAVIEAPENAPPGSMVALTQFLNAQPGIRASAGYAGESRDHVLRVSGFQDESAFLALLKEGFPKWQSRLPALENTVSFSPDLKVEKMGAPNSEQVAGLTSALKNNADMLTGLSYSAGNLALLLSGMWGRGEKGARGPRDPLRMATAASYMISSTLLIIFAKNPQNTRDIYAILEDTYPEIRQADNKTKNQVKKLVDDVWQFTHNYTWEITSGITGMGAAFQFLSAQRAGNKTEMIASVGTITAMAIAALVPEKGGRSMFEGLGIGRNRNQAISEKTLLEEHNVDVEKLAEHSNGLADIARENPLGISAAIQAISNVGYGAATFAKGGRDWALAAVSGTSLLGNVFQSFASKGRGYAVDDVVSAAADVMMADPYFAKDHPNELRARATKLAKRLSKEPEIVQTPGQLAPAIERRVLQRSSDQPPSKSGLVAFTKRERPTMQQSPFLVPRHTLQLADLEQNAGIDAAIAMG